MAEQELRVLVDTVLPYRFRLAGPERYGPTGQGSFLGFPALPLVPA